MYSKYTLLFYICNFFKQIFWSAKAFTVLLFHNLCTSPGAINNYAIKLTSFNLSDSGSLFMHCAIVHIAGHHNPVVFTALFKVSQT
jgi:hypothetical protein